MRRSRARATRFGSDCAPGQRSASRGGRPTGRVRRADRCEWSASECRWRMPRLPRAGGRRRRCVSCRYLIAAMVRKLLLAAALLLVIIVAWEWITFPNVAELATQPPRTTAFMERRKAELRAQGKDDSIEYRWTSYGNISPYL